MCGNTDKERSQCGARTGAGLDEELQITVTPLTSQNNLPGMSDNALLMQGSNSVSH